MSSHEACSVNDPLLVKTLNRFIFDPNKIITADNLSQTWLTNRISAVRATDARCFHEKKVILLCMYNRNKKGNGVLPFWPERYPPCNPSKVTEEMLCIEKA